MLKTIAVCAGTIFFVIWLVVAMYYHATGNEEWKWYSSMATIILIATAYFNIASSI